jgi:uncharacterized iron-regulated membrane protein
MAALPPKKKKNNKSRFKRISAWLHLWLGLASGIIVVIVSLTGCTYVFEHEIKDMLEDWRFVKPQRKAFLLPSQIVNLADQRMKGQHASSVTFSGRDEAAIVGYFTPAKEGQHSGKVAAMDSKARLTAGNRKAEGLKRKEVKPKRGRGGIFTSIYMNPYTGEVQKLKASSRGESPDFFRFMLNGHRALWLPYTIGRPIVGVAILIFVVLLISGLVLWWPVKWIKSIRDKSFKIKWSASFKRANYDMHNVLGFYSMIFLLFISLTGLVWSFEWFSKSLYWVTSGGAHLTDVRRAATSDTTQARPFEISAADKIWLKLKKENPEAAGILISIPGKPADVIGAFVYQKMNTFYNMDRYSFDQQSLKALKTKSPFDGKYTEANIPDKIRRMNYDVHVGAILGLPGKIIAFFASLISASLPVTGFLIWWGKKKKNKKRAENPETDEKKGIPAKKISVKEEEPVYS